VKLKKSPRSTKATAEALKVPAGAIVKAAIYKVGKQAVMVLMAGDKRCASEALPRAFNLKGKVVRVEAGQVGKISGFAANGISPVGSKTELPTVIDVSLRRFDAVYAPAGHPQHVFATTAAELKSLTTGLVSYNITKGDAHNPAKT